MLIRDAAGKPLWSGPIPMTDQTAGFPFAQFAVPGRDVGLQLLLQRQTDGTGVMLVLPFRAQGTNADGTPNVVGLQPVALAQGESATPGGTDFSIELRGFSDYTLLIAKKDPGADLAWLAFGLLIVGLLITFWMPRRRVWSRLDPDGRLAMTFRADRYVDVGREYGALLSDLVARRPALPRRAAMPQGRPHGRARPLSRAPMRRTPSRRTPERVWPRFASFSRRSSLTRPPWAGRCPTATRLRASPGCAC